MATAPFTPFYSTPYAYPSSATAVYPPPASGSFPAPAYGPYSFPSTTTYPPPPYPGGYYTSPFPYAATYYPPPASACTPAAGFSPAPAYGPSTYPYAAASPCLTSAATPIPTNAEPNWPPPAPESSHITPTSTPQATSPTPTHDSVQFSPPPPAGRPATAPLGSPDQVPGSPLPTNLSRPTPQWLDTIPAAPNRESCKSQRHTSSRSSDPSFPNPSTNLSSSKAVFHSSASRTQQDIELLLKFPDRDALPKGNNKKHADDQRARMEDDATVLAVAADRVPVKDTIRHRLQRELLNIQARLDQQQARERTSFNTIKAAPAPVAPQVFAEMPTLISMQGNYGAAYDYCSGHHNTTLSTCVPDGNSNLSEQNLDGMPQAYGLHNLDRQSIFLADDTEHSYFTLPPDYPAVLEPVFVVHDDKTESDSDESFDVFSTTTPEQQPYEEAQQEDVQDYTLELQHKDDERACGCPVLKASDSTVSSSNQLSIDHTMRELRLLWDPGPSALLVTPVNNGSNNTTITSVNSSKWLKFLSPTSCECSGQAHKCLSKPIFSPEKPPVGTDIEQLLICSSTTSQCTTCDEESQGDNKVLWEKSVCQTATGHPLLFFLWDPGDTKFHSLFTHAASATKLQCTYVYKPDLIHVLAVTFGAHVAPISASTVMCYLAFEWRWTEVNATAVRMAKQSMLLSHGGNNKTHHSFLKMFMHSLCTTIVVQVTKQRHPLEFHLMTELLQNESEFRDGQLAYMSEGTSIDSPEWVRHTITILSCWLPSFEMVKLQWDPGIALSLYMPQGTTINYADWVKHDWVKHKVQYCCLQIVLACPYSVLACYPSMFNSTEAIHSARSVSTATTICVILVLGSAKTIQEENDVVVVYQVSKIQLPMRKTTHVWDPGIHSLRLVYIWLHIHKTQLVDCTSTATHACYSAPACSPPTPMSTQASSDTELDELTSPCVGFHLQQSTK